MPLAKKDSRKIGLWSEGLVKQNQTRDGIIVQHFYAKDTKRGKLHPFFCPFEILKLMVCRLFVWVLNSSVCTVTV